jgi:hypothetical protein
MQREVLARPDNGPDLAPNDFYLFGPLTEALGGKQMEPTMQLNICATIAAQATTNTFERGVMKLSEPWRRVDLYRFRQNMQKIGILPVFPF